MGHKIHVRVESSSGPFGLPTNHKYHAVAWDESTRKKAEAWGDTKEEARANAIANLQDKLAGG